MNTLLLLGALIIGVGGGGLVGVLVNLVVIALVFWLIWWILDWMKLPAPVNMIARVILGLLAIVVLLRLIGIY